MYSISKNEYENSEYLLKLLTIGTLFKSSKKCVHINDPLPLPTKMPPHQKLKIIALTKAIQNLNIPRIISSKQIPTKSFSNILIHDMEKGRKPFFTQAIKTAQAWAFPPLPPSITSRIRDQCDYVPKNTKLILYAYKFLGVSDLPCVYRSTQLDILNRTNYSRNKLFKMKMTDSPYCLHPCCQNSVADSEHMFILCPLPKLFIFFLEQYLKQWHGPSLLFEEIELRLLYSLTDNMIILLCPLDRSKNICITYP